MKMIIFEGIATSGKTTLERLFVEQIDNAVIVPEDDTLMRLIDNRDPEIAHAHLLDLIEQMNKREDTFLIIDRFHLTHAFRTGESLSFFQEIENHLQKHNVLLVLFTVDPMKIKERVEETTKRRAGGWTKGKAGTIEERVDYYTNQQHELKRLFAASVLPKIEIDTTEKNWNAYLKEILSRV